MWAATYMRQVVCPVCQMPTKFPDEILSPLAPLLGSHFGEPWEAEDVDVVASLSDEELVPSALDVESDLGEVVELESDENSIQEGDDVQEEKTALMGWTPSVLFQGAKIYMAGPLVYYHGQECELVTNRTFLHACKVEYVWGEDVQLFTCFYENRAEFRNAPGGLDCRMVHATPLTDGHVILATVGPFHLASYSGVRSHILTPDTTIDLDVLRRFGRMVAPLAIGQKNQFNLPLLGQKLYNEVVRQQPRPWPNCESDCFDFVSGNEFAEMVYEAEKLNLARRPVVRATLWMRSLISTTDPQWFLEFLVWYREARWIFLPLLFLVSGVATAVGYLLHSWVGYLMAVFFLGLLLVFLLCVNVGELPAYTPADTLYLLKRCSKGCPLPPVQEGVVIKRPTYYEDDCSCQKRVDVFGCVIRKISCVVPTSCVHNLYNGLRIRMTFARHWDSLECARWLIFGLKWCRSNLKRGCWKDICKEEYLREVKPSRRNKLIQDDNGDVRSGCEIRNIFTKNEVYVGKLLDSFKPRIICCMQTPFQLLVAMYLYGVAKWVITCCNQTPYQVTCEMTALEIGAWVQMYSYFVECDATNWDGSFTPWMKYLEYLVIFFLAPVPSSFRDRVSRGFLGFQAASKGVVVKMSHGRYSGDFMTSAGNSLMNILLSLYVFGSFKAGLFLGDDNITAHDQIPNLKEIEAKYKSLGFKAKLVVRVGWQKLRYCSGWFYPTSSGLKWGVAPFRQLAKFGYNTKNRPRREWQGLLFGTCLSMLPIAGHVPVFGDLLRALITDAERRNVKAVFPEEERYGIRDFSVDEVPSDLTYFSERYNFSMEEIELLRNTVRSMTLMDFPCVLEHELFSRGCLVDMDMECGTEESWFEMSGRPTIKVGWSWLYEEGLRWLSVQWSLQLALGLTVLVGLLELGLGAHPLNLCIHVVCYALQVRWGILPAMVVHYVYNRWALGVHLPVADVIAMIKTGGRWHWLPITETICVKSECKALPLIGRELFNSISNCVRPYKERLMEKTLGCEFRWIRDLLTKNPLRETSILWAQVKSLRKTKVIVQGQSMRTKPQKVVVVERKRKSKKHKNKKARAGNWSRTNEDLYRVAAINPFVPEVQGLRIPDSFSYPTAAIVERSSFTCGNDSTYTTGFGQAYYPFIRYALQTTSSVTSGGTITWSSGTTNSTSHYSTLSAVLQQYRTAAWGIRISCEQSLTTATGHLWVAHMPIDPSSSFTSQSYLPTTEGQISALPGAEKFALSELCQQGLVLSGRRYNESSYWFGDYASNGGYNTWPNGPGWCAIVLYAVGTAGGGSSIVLNIEHIMHIEAVMDPASSSVFFPDSLCCPPSYACLEDAIKAQQMTPSAYPDDGTMNWFGVIERLLSGKGGSLFNSILGLGHRYLKHKFGGSDPTDFISIDEKSWT